MNISLWEHGVILLAALVFVLVKVVADIDYENLKKWRYAWKENWTFKAKAGLVLIILVCTVAVHQFVMRIISK